MNEDALKYAERLVPHSYIDLARQARRSYEQKIRQIIEHRKLPDQPLEENIIEQWLNEIAQMDSNNFEGNIGVGEREGKKLKKKLNI
jgi:O-phospho-L-seryl-tRNASec:L-selenocysteinyl-tRNA synthase